MNTSTPRPLEDLRSVGIEGNGYGDLRAELRRMEDLLVHQSHAASMGQLVALLSHELRQPLQTVMGCAEDLPFSIRRADGAGIREALRALTGSVRQMADTIRLVQEYASSGSASADRLQIGDAVRGILDLLAHRLKHRRIAVRAALPEQPLWAAVPPGAGRGLLLRLTMLAIDQLSGPGAALALVVDTDGQAIAVQLQAELPQQAPRTESGAPDDEREWLTAALIARHLGAELQCGGGAGSPLTIRLTMPAASPAG